MTRFKDYFYGHKISDYGLQHGRVDYRTLASAFDAVLNNDIMSKTWDIGYWEQISGFVDNSEQIEEFQEKIDAIQADIYELEEQEEQEDKIEELQNEISSLEEQIEELQEEQDNQKEIFQWYIVSDSGAAILEEFGEVVYYNEELDMYLWGVDHCGTSWDYVLTDIPCEKKEGV